MTRLFDFLRPKTARKTRADSAFLKAKAAYDDALDRGDTRDQARLWSVLRDARTEQMMAQKALAAR